MNKTFLLLSFFTFQLIAYTQVSGDESFTHEKAAFTKLENENYTEAIIEFSKSIKLANPEKSYHILELYHCRAHCKNMLAKYQNAINDYDTIISLSEQWNFIQDDIYSSAFYYKGLCELFLDRNEQACKNLRIASELGYSKANEMINVYCDN